MQLSQTGRPCVHETAESQQLAAKYTGCVVDGWQSQAACCVCVYCLAVSIEWKAVSAKPFVPQK